MNEGAAPVAESETRVMHDENGTPLASPFADLRAENERLGALLDQAADRIERALHGIGLFVLEPAEDHRSEAGDYYAAHLDAAKVWMDNLRSLAADLRGVRADTGKENTNG